MHQEPHIVSLFEQAIANNEVPSSLSPEQRVAIVEAQAGNWGPADTLELAYLNDSANKIQPHEKDGTAFESEDGGRWTAKLLERGRAPNGQIAVTWHSCPECNGRGTLNIDGKTVTSMDCPECGGEPNDTVVTDIDGLVLDSAS